LTCGKCGEYQERSAGFERVFELSHYFLPWFEVPFWPLAASGEYNAILGELPVTFCNYEGAKAGVQPRGQISKGAFETLTANVGRRLAVRRSKLILKPAQSLS